MPSPSTIAGDGLGGLEIHRPVNLQHRFGDGDLAAEAEQLEAPVHHHRAIHRRERRHQLREFQDRLFERAQLARPRAPGRTPSPRASRRGARPRPAVWRRSTGSAGGSAGACPDRRTGTSASRRARRGRRRRRAARSAACRRDGRGGSPTAPAAACAVRRHARHRRSPSAASSPPGSASHWRTTSARTGANRRGSHADRKTSWSLSRNRPPCSSTSAVDPRAISTCPGDSTCTTSASGSDASSPSRPLCRCRSHCRPDEARPQMYGDPSPSAWIPISVRSKSAAGASRRNSPSDRRRDGSNSSTCNWRAGRHGMSCSADGAATSRRKRSDRLSSRSKTGVVCRLEDVVQRARRRQRNADGPPSRQRLSSRVDTSGG